MKRYLYYLVFVLFLAVIGGCSDSDTITDDPGGDFDLTITAAALPASTIPFNVVYTATASGDGKISKIDYYDENGATKSVTNPTLPWTKAVTMNGGRSVYMYAKGNSSTGRVDISCVSTAGTVTITYAKNVVRSSL